MKFYNLKLTALVGILIIIAAVVAFIGSGSDSDNFPKVVKAVMIGVVAAIGTVADEIPQEENDE
jgi:VIT1/CCC1 family predicted Fe2+/Mn2+ transporter